MQKSIQAPKKICTTKHWHIQKTWAHPKSLADGKNSAQMKILVSIEMLAPGKN